MKDEIKEILDKLEYDKDDVYYVGYTNGVNIDNTLMPKDIKLLLDCITNLQEENENLKEDFKRHIDRINELTERNDKAIEYIKDNLYYLVDNDDKNLLNILNGSNK